MSRTVDDAEARAERAQDDPQPEGQPTAAEEVDGVVVPEAELQEAVEDAMANTEMVVADARDAQDVYVAMDAHDAARLVERLTTQAQESNLGKRWIYEFKGSDGKWVRGLTVDAVEDIVQQMNWTGKCAIGVLPETMVAKLIEGEDDEKEWDVTIAAEDGRTGSRLMGTSQEPQAMKLKNGTRKFDKFAKGKALSKAQRNAMESFIPEVVKLTLIAMAAKNPELVERIQTEGEAKVAELPPPLDTPEARKLISELNTTYDEIKALGGGKGRLHLPPGQYGAYRLQAQHSIEALERMKDWLLLRRDEITEAVK